MRIEDEKLLDRMAKYQPMPDHDALILNIAMTEQLTDVLLGEGGIRDKVQALAEDNVAMKTYWKVAVGVLIFVVAPVLTAIIIYLLTGG